LTFQQVYAYYFDGLAGVRRPFCFRHDLPAAARGSAQKRLVQPLRILIRGQSQERPRLNVAQNNDARTDT
jgi:hypothetical protein